MSENPLIRLEKLALSLKGPGGDVHILRDIDLTVNGGERLGIMGRSGSGKTSLLLVLAGLERISGGRIEVAGREIARMKEDELAVFRRHTIGIVFQNFHLVPGMTALENVAVPLEFAGDRDAFAKAREALETVGLTPRLRHFPAQLSGGEQQRVALARAFVMRPRILLADEPTGNLDQENGEHIMELMFDLHRRHGTTLLLVTHDQALADRCDRIVTLGDGKIIYMGKT
jgi:putative ABC transport system ATP-binding protein